MMISKRPINAQTNELWREQSVHAIRSSGLGNLEPVTRDLDVLSLSSGTRTQSKTKGY